MLLQLLSPTRKFDLQNKPEEAAKARQEIAAGPLQDRLAQLEKIVVSLTAVTFVCLQDSKHVYGSFNCNTEVAQLCVYKIASMRVALSTVMLIGPCLRPGAMFASVAGVFSIPTTSCRVASRTPA